MERRSEASTARPPATKSPFLLMTNQNISSPTHYHQNQPPDRFGYRCMVFTAIHTVCVFVILQVQFSVERGGTTDLSRRPKIFVKAAI